MLSKYTIVLFCNHPLYFHSTVFLWRLESIWRVKTKSILSCTLFTGFSVLWTFEISHDIFNVPQNTLRISVCPLKYKFKYINVSKTHWECQCVMETIMYLNYIFQRTHWYAQCVLETFEIWYLEMSLKTHWEILLINVWSVWSVLWRTSQKFVVLMTKLYISSFWLRMAIRDVSEWK